MESGKKDDTSSISSYDPSPSLTTVLPGSNSTFLSEQRQSVYEGPILPPFNTTQPAGQRQQQHIHRHENSYSALCSRPTSRVGDLPPIARNTRLFPARPQATSMHFGTSPSYGPHFEVAEVRRQSSPDILPTRSATTTCYSRRPSAGSDTTSIISGHTSLYSSRSPTMRNHPTLRSHSSCGNLSASPRDSSASFGLYRAAPNFHVSHNVQQIFEQHHQEIFGRGLKRPRPRPILYDPTMDGGNGFYAASDPGIEEEVLYSDVGNERAFSEDEI